MRLHTRVLGGVCVFLACLALAPSASANLLVNSGFEAGDFSGWTIGGNSTDYGVATDATLITGADAPFPPNDVNVRSGDFAGWALVRQFDGLERIMLTQTVNVLADTNYDVGFWLGNDSQAVFGVDIDDSNLQIFVNGVGLLGPGFMNIPTGSTTADFVNFDSSWYSGSDTSATITFAITGSGTSRVGASFDDFYFNGPAGGVVPEPASLALLGLGLVGMGARSLRRK